MLFDHHDRDLELFSKGVREVLSKEITIFVLIWGLCCVASGILLPYPGIEHVPPAVEAQSRNHCITKEVLQIRF